MKNTLSFNYKLDAKEILKVNEFCYSFYIDYDKYNFIRIVRPRKDIEEILEIIKNYKQFFHYFILNRFNTIFTQYEEEDYILLKINGPIHNEIDIMDIVKNQYLINSNSKSVLNRTNWNKLWEEKVDYLEYQVSELATSYKIIKNSFSYYVGLAENAIEYFNLLNPINAETVISRRRIKYPTYTIDYFNPVNVVIDYRARDLAGYLKAKFFANEDVDKEIDWLIDKKILSPLEYNLIYCRLLYPSYYFDEMQRVFEMHGNEDIILKYIERVSEYEKFLIRVYNKFSKHSSMIKIDWLLSKEN